MSATVMLYDVRIEGDYTSVVDRWEYEDGLTRPSDCFLGVNDVERDVKKLAAAGAAGSIRVLYMAEGESDKWVLRDGKVEVYTGKTVYQEKPYKYL